jgi:hypothetical protein
METRCLGISSPSNTSFAYKLTVWFQTYDTATQEFALRVVYVDLSSTVALPQASTGKDYSGTYKYTNVTYAMLNGTKEAFSGFFLGTTKQVFMPNSVTWKFTQGFLNRGTQVDPDIPGACK